MSKELVTRLGAAVMAERRLITLDGIAAAFAAVGALLAACVLSHGMSESNWLGIPGHGFAETLLGSLGLAVHLMLAGWAMLTIHLIVWRHWGKWTARLAGWTMLVFVVA